TLKVNYNKPLSGSIGWMDYIALNARRNLRFGNGQLAFRDPSSTGPGNIAEYVVSNASQTLVVWDVTDPVDVMRVSATIDGSSLRFRLPAEELHEYIVFDGSSYYSTQFVGKVPNQNLHAIATPDLVIISHASFLSEANRLASHHRDFDDMDVFVVDVEKIYNEFSSGAQDITAIRDFMKMLYDEAQGGDECRYLILFGDASYDYKNREENNSNYVPTWEDKRSMNIISSIATDDYYGFLDDGEGGGGSGNLLDVGIGRIVVSSQESARQMVNKFIHYATGGEDVYGSWRNIVCFVADDEDGNLHMQSHAEKMAVKLDTAYGSLNVDKIYLDAYRQVSTSGGQRAPEVNEAINRRMEKGALIMNYTGHGGEAGWAHERILGISDINAWTNYDRLPIFITATCEFSRYDDPTRTSAGEYVLLNPDGGAVALFTTARATYGSPNFELNNAMFDYMFEKENGEYPRFGDLIRLSKNQNGSISDNDKKFILLGDPAMRLAYPRHGTNTIKINNIAVSNQPDTLKALQKVTVSGSVVDENGSLLESYNGILRPTVFDKPAKIETLVTDPDSKPFTFDLLLAILYKGKAQVTGGKFSFSFIVPKDIAYKYGYGKISYYASNAEEDANGYFKNIIIGGYDNNVAPDNTGPEIELYLNDENFAFGGITDENPVLLAYIRDSSGVNTVGTGIGHDIVTTLDNDNNKSVIINDYYESDIDSYSSGVVKYPYNSLSEGNHSLKLKVWDVHNNSSESYTEFVVSSSAELALEHVLNYPNPFTTSTAFYFDHNQPGSMLEVQIQIFTVSGRLIKTIDEFVMTNGFRSDPIYWDGLDDFGDRIGRGVYIYKLRVRSQDGSFAQKLEKLVILR
ncbi:MAG TPA: type IX secretion system sortase PorU, partial [Bacteroidales bacterium]|nr:type IX secretion system sortase PorU [Bacteroidales bacterium]